MFIWFASVLGNNATDLFTIHPGDLVALLEYAWDHRANDPSPIQTGDPRRRSELQGLTATWTGQFFRTPPPPQPPPVPPSPLQQIVTAIDNTTFGCGGVMWEHLMYAYMLENTRVLEIFRRVLEEFIYGEKLGLAREETQQWLRTTEALWFTDPSPFGVSAVSSYLRREQAGSRRNLYQRVFGMDLNHGAEGGGPYPYKKSEIANNDFVPTFEEFLREVWVAMINVTNSSGPKPTDDAKISNLATRLHDMLMSRRIYGTIGREEFVYVSMLQWFDLVLSDQPRNGNLPVIVDLRSEAGSPEERLFKVARRVDSPAHLFSQSYLQIAFPISRILILLETGAMDDVPAVAALYTPGSPIESDMRRIIRHWAVISGRDPKSGKVTAS